MSDLRTDRLRAARGGDLRRMLSEWTSITLAAAARRLNLREEQAAADLAAAGARTFRRAGVEWVRGASTARRWAEKPEAR